MIDENFIYLGILINALGSLNYLIQTLQGKVKPNKVTFLLWAVAPLIAFAAQIQKGVGIPSLLTLSVGLFPLAIFVASFFNKKAQWKLGMFDFICGGLSVFGLILWYLTKDGNVAIALALFADGLAALPTILKSYFNPETESAVAYSASSISGLLTLLTLDKWTFENASFSLYIFLVNLLIFSLVKFRIGYLLKH